MHVVMRTRPPMTPPIMAPMTYFEELDSLAVSKKNPLSSNVLIKTTQNEVFKHGINALCKSVREFIIIALTIICVFITCNHCEIIR